MSTTIKELVNVAAEAGQLTKVAAESLLAAVFGEISNQLKAGNEVVIRDFGRLYSKVKPARTARNPKTGEVVQVAEKTVIKFAPRGSLK